MPLMTPEMAEHFKWPIEITTETLMYRLWDGKVQFDRDRWPVMIHYRVGLEDSKAQLTEPTSYRCDGEGPSDCTWIIPGTTP